MTRLLVRYRNSPLMGKLLVAFVLGALLGSIAWYIEARQLGSSKEFLNVYVAPLGHIFIQLLRMVVVPIVFCTLLLGAANLPLGRLGQVGAKLLGLYLLTSLVAALVGMGLALWMNPGAGAAGEWLRFVKPELTSELQKKAPELASPKITDIVMGMFGNPFEALAASNFLAIIVFAILFGLALSSVAETELCDEVKRGSRIILDLLGAINAALYKMVHWIMGYAPFGVLALTCVNFGLYGPAIVGPYLRVVGGIILGISLMTFGVYALFIKLWAGKSPVEFFRNIKEPMLTAFVTRSSAAALPVSMDAAIHKLKIEPEVASFALPLGATINMDGVCVHLPMFAILAANIFGISLSVSDLFVLVASTVLAAIGTGGIPGGSMMLLFIVLSSLGLSQEQIAVVVALALGVNPILDMFETMNNVTGDLMCTYLVGRTNEKAETSELASSRSVASLGVSADPFA